MAFFQELNYGDIPTDYSKREESSKGIWIVQLLK